MFEFKLPDVGEGMHEAEILRWLIKPGEVVKLDQPMLEIQTDKAMVEIPAPVAGTVEQINFKEGQLARVGDILITFRPATPNASAANGSGQQQSQNQPPKTFSTTLAVATPTATVSSNGIIPRKPGDVRAAPAVRKRAVELDVDITKVKPGSPDGRVLLQDVEAFAAAPKLEPTFAPVQPQAPISNGNGNGHVQAVAPVVALSESGQAEKRVALAGLRRRIAERMELSWRTIPHVAVFDEADTSELVTLRESLKGAAEKRGVKLTYLPFIVKAVVATLKQHPVFNSTFDEKSREVVYKNFYNIGLATSTPDGLLVPVVQNANRLSLLELAAEINRLSEGGRNRSLKANELSGSTFTISNVGSYGGVSGTAIINPPEAAILATGKMQEKAVVRAGQVVARPIMPLSVSFDHRLIDGADAGAFLTTLKSYLENPNLLLLDSI